jgi:hypothetical protein
MNYRAFDVNFDAFWVNYSRFNYVYFELFGVSGLLYILTNLSR